MDDAHLLRPLHCGCIQRAVPHQLGKGSNGSVHRFRPADTDGLRPGSRARTRRSGQGGCTRRAPRPHADAPRRHSTGRDEHVDDDQCHCRLVACALRRQRQRTRRHLTTTAGHHPKRHREGIPLARNVHLPAAALQASDRRHDCLVLHQRTEVEPDERVLVSLAGSGCYAGSGSGVLARQCHRHPRCSARKRPGTRRKVSRGIRFDVILRKRRNPFRRGDVQDARLHPTVGAHRPRALWHHRRPRAAFSLWRASELTRPHRSPT